MAVKQDTGLRTEEQTWRSLVGHLSRYDLLLAAIPIFFALGAFGTIALSVPFHAAVASGAILSIVLLVDALYINPPTAG